MKPVEVARSAGPDDWTTQRTGKTSLEIDAGPLKSEVRDHELRTPDLYDYAVANLVIVFQIKHSDSLKAAVVFDRSFDAISEC